MTTEPPRILHGDCIDIMRTLPENSVDSIVTDPPYGLSNASPAQVSEAIVAWGSGDREFIPEGKGFMGKSWDAFVPPPALWDEAMRVLKPGGHLLAFAGTRTQDLMGISIRLAGFEIRENLAWMHGQGFPKSHDVSKAIDKAAGAEREVIGVGQYAGRGRRTDNAVYGESTPSAQETITAPATPAAQQWEGWGTALKPAFEPVVMARKPLAAKTVAANVQEHGTGAINIDGCRIGTTRAVPASHSKTASAVGVVGIGANRLESELDPNMGRWPANVVLDEHMAAVLDQQSGVTESVRSVRLKPGAVIGNGQTHGAFIASKENVGGFNDSGGASRFFKVAESYEHGAISPHFPREFDDKFMYVAKAPKRERPVVDGVAHPTVKPLALMRWLVKLVTPPGGVVLEPFAGSGATVEACILEGFHCIAIEREAEYLPLIQARIDRQDAAA